MDPHCDGCFFLFKTLESCPRDYPFDNGNILEMLLEIFWLFGSLQPFIIVAVLIWCIFWKKSLRSFLILMNLIIIVFINELIFKKILSETRPKGACSSSFGLPSGHSAFAGALMVWFILEWTMFHELASFKTSRHYSKIRNIIIIFAPVNPISRNFLNYHSEKQVLVGFIEGSVWAFMFFYFVILMHKNSADSWSSRLMQRLKKMKLKDDFASFVGGDHFQLLDEETDEGINDNTFQLINLLPLRSDVNRFMKMRENRNSLSMDMKL